MPRDFLQDQKIGDVFVGRGTYWDEAAPSPFVTYGVEEIKIGRYCSIAAGVVIVAGGDHDYSRVSTWPFENFLDERPNPTRTYRVSRDTEIGSDVWIGYGAHVAGGSKIGHGAVIGARAVVRGDVPPYAIVAGNPATIRKFRFTPEQIESLLAIAWWSWPPEKVAAEREWFYRPVNEFISSFLGG